MQLDAQKVKHFFKIIVCAVGVFAILGSLYYPIVKHTGKSNNYVLLADSFLHGRLDSEEYFHDMAVHNGKHYVIYPPLPAVLLMPFVAIFGVLHTKAVLVSLILTLLNIAMLKRIFQKLEVPLSNAKWIIIAFVFGSPYWLAVIKSTWVQSFFGHVVAVTCLLLAIDEALGKSRWYLIGLYAGMAFLTRQFCIYSLVLLGCLWWNNTSSLGLNAKIKSALSFTSVFAFSIGIYLALNWLRFGNIFDTGYSHFVLQGYLKERFNEFGLFHPAYVLFNFIYLFFQGPHFTFGGDGTLVYQGLDRFGTSLTFASPYIFISFAARWKRKLLAAAWIVIALSIIHLLFYYGNGKVQINAQRYTLDFFPILIILVALGTKYVPALLWKVMVVYSVVLNSITLFFVPVTEKLLNFDTELILTQ